MKPTEELAQLAKMERTEEAAFAARSLLLNEYDGILSTHSADVSGYPFGSVVPYCLDAEGRPVILICKIAQHTKNIHANPKVSLIVKQSGIDDTQVGARLTWIGEAELIEEREVIAERYYAFFPQARAYDEAGIHKTYNFDFYRINLTKARYIGGFGKIYWVNNEFISKENPLFGQSEAGIVQHMNEDHVDAMVKYCQTAGIELPDGVKPVMAGINAEGIHLRIDRKIVFIRFPEELAQPSDARQQLVAMARAV